MTLRFGHLGAALLVCIVVAVWTEPALAIPAFARAYDVPCSTCHSAITRRNEFGDAFRKAGYRWPEGIDRERAARKGSPVVMKGVSLWETVLPDQVPLAVSATLSASATDDPDVEDPVTLGSPSARLLFGTALGDHVSSFGTWSGGTAPDELFVGLDRLAGGPELSLRLGRFEQNTTLFKNNEALIGKYVSSSSALNGHAVAQGRTGAEANGVVLRRLFWATGVVQNGGPATPFDGYYHLSSRVAGADFAGEEPDVDLEDTSLLDDITLTIAHWAYIGGVADESGREIARIRRVAFEGKLGFRDFSLWGGLQRGLDQDLSLDRGVPSVSWFLEGTYPILPWLVASYLYQYQDASSFRRAYQLHDAGVIVLLLENVRARLKVQYSDDRTQNESGEAQLFLAF